MLDINSGADYKLPLFLQFPANQYVYQNVCRTRRRGSSYDC
jgi:hypothetical protein